MFNSLLISCCGSYPFEVIAEPRFALRLKMDPIFTIRSAERGGTLPPAELTTETLWLSYLMGDSEMPPPPIYIFEFRLKLSRFFLLESGNGMTKQLLTSFIALCSYNLTVWLRYYPPAVVVPVFC